MLKIRFKKALLIQSLFEDHKTRNTCKLCNSFKKLINLFVLEGQSKISLIYTVFTLCFIKDKEIYF